MAVLSLNLVFGAAMGLPPNARGQDSSVPEYQMKAAYIYNFAKFVEWPAKDLPPGDSQLVIGILGPDPFDGVLDNTVKGKKIDNHPLVVRHIDSPSDAKSCQILFISSSEKKLWPEISANIAGAGVLTVSENWDHFIQDGGIVYLFIDDKKICFDINDDAAKREGLTVSSKLMQLAKKPPAARQIP